MHRTRRFVSLLAVFTLALSGCGTFRNDRAAEVAETDRAVLVYNGPSAGVSVSHIDGQDRGVGLYRRYELATGPRTVTAFLNLPGTNSRLQSVEFTAERAGKYELLYATTRDAFGGGGTWRIWVIDSATGTTVSRPSRFVPGETQATSAKASADPSCAVRAVKLLAEGKATQLANSFSGRPTVVSQLNELAARTGALSAIEQTAAPRFKSHHRQTVGHAVSPYTGAWVNATSALLGDVQFHVAMSPAAPCELFALHLDTAKP
jgi:hypothetical protein